MLKHLTSPCACCHTAVPLALGLGLGSTCLSSEVPLPTATHIAMGYLDRHAAWFGLIRAGSGLGSRISRCTCCGTGLCPSTTLSARCPRHPCTSRSLRRPCRSRRPAESAGNSRLRVQNKSSRVPCRRDRHERYALRNEVRPKTPASIVHEVGSVPSSPQLCTIGHRRGGTILPESWLCILTAQLLLGSG